MKNGYTLSPINSWYGKRWAVLDENKNVMTTPDGATSFPYDKAGLARAQKLLKDLRSGKAV